MMADFSLSICVCFRLSCSIGKVGDVYRPVDSSSNLKEFVLVGFYDAAEAKAATSQIKSAPYIGSVAVTADEAKPWLLDLYPR
jgi:hypothetical protein